MGIQVGIRDCVYSKIKDHNEVAGIPCRYVQSITLRDLVVIYIIAIVAYPYLPNL